nr:type II toxin-antitoxin system YoeB family toxin [Acinetobacter pittii]
MIFNWTDQALYDYLYWQSRVNQTMKRCNTLINGFKSAHHLMILLKLPP